MSDIIQFLERMGADARWRHASGETLLLALDEAELDSEHRAAVIVGDVSALQALLGCLPFMAVQLPDHEEDEEEQEDESEEAPASDSLRRTATLA